MNRRAMSTTLHKLALAAALALTAAGCSPGASQPPLEQAPLAGAAIGEYIAIRDMVQARRVGVATWIGMMVGAVLKIAITFLMIGVFVGALLI